MCDEESTHGVLVLCTELPDGRATPPSHAILPLIVVRGIALVHTLSASFVAQLLLLLLPPCALHRTHEVSMCVPRRASTLEAPFLYLQTWIMCNSGQD